MEFIKPFIDQGKNLKAIPTDLEKRVYRDKDIKCIIFDVYGTLLISEAGDIDHNPLEAASMMKAFEYCGIDLHTEDKEKAAKELLHDYLDNIVSELDRLSQLGIDHPEIEIRDVWNKIIAKAHDNNVVLDEIDAKTRDRLAIVFELLNNPVAPTAKMNFVLKALQENNYPLGIVSNAQFYTPIIMSYFMNRTLRGGSDLTFFESDLVFLSYKYHRGKPSIFLFKELLTIIKESYHLKGKNVLYIGNDMYKDVYPARKVGLKTALFAGDKRSLRLRSDKRALEGIYPDFIIKDLGDIFEII